ncbi:MAG: invasion associated locus B family protein [Sulfitobacter sp.]
MTNFLTSLSICAALAITAPAAVFAQETETTNEAEQPAAPAAPAADDQLSLGEDATNTPQVGQPYTREKIGDWEIRCIKAKEGEEPCQMYQLLDDGQGAPVAEVSLFRLPEGGQAVAGATVIVPLETALPQQLTLAIDGNNARRYPYSFCNPVGCYVRLGLTPNDVASFKRGNDAKLTIVPALAPDQTVELTMSLTGFTAAFDKVSIREQ